MRISLSILYASCIAYREKLKEHNLASHIVQLVEHLVLQGDVGSNPIMVTIYRRKIKQLSYTALPKDNTIIVEKGYGHYID